MSSIRNSGGGALRSFGLPPQSFAPGAEGGGEVLGLSSLLALAVGTRRCSMALIWHGTTQWRNGAGMEHSGEPGIECHNLPEVQRHAETHGWRTAAGLMAKHILE